VVLNWGLTFTIIAGFCQLTLEDSLIDDIVFDHQDLLVGRRSRTIRAGSACRVGLALNPFLGLKDSVFRYCEICGRRRARWKASAHSTFDEESEVLNERSRRHGQRTHHYHFQVRLKPRYDRRVIPLSLPRSANSLRDCGMNCTYSCKYTSPVRIHRIVNGSYR
jgi:hypothetical protein